MDYRSFLSDSPVLPIIEIDKNKKRTCEKMIDNKKSQCTIGGYSDFP